MTIGGEKIRPMRRLARKGYDYGCQIRERINGMRALGMEPKCVWIGSEGAKAMRALWFDACGERWDGVLPKLIAGVPCREGSTGGQDYVIERYDDAELEAVKRARSPFKVVDNPLQGTH